MVGFVHRVVANGGQPFPTKDTEMPSSETKVTGLSVEQRLWTVRDVANFLGVSLSWVYHRAERGELPHLRIGGLLRFNPISIREFATAQSTDVSPPTRMGG
jgi:excisionase family DNA binding protein